MACCVRIQPIEHAVDVVAHQIPVIGAFGNDRRIRRKVPATVCHVGRNLSDPDRRVYVLRECVQVLPHFLELLDGDLPVHERIIFGRIIHWIVWVIVGSVGPVDRIRVNGPDVHRRRFSVRALISGNEALEPDLPTHICIWIAAIAEVVPVKNARPCNFGCLISGLDIGVVVMKNIRELRSRNSLSVWLAAYVPGGASGSALYQFSDSFG